MNNCDINTKYIKKYAIYFIIVNVIAWSIFTIADYVQEKTHDDTLENVMLCGLPVLICIAYICMEIKNKDISKSLKDFVIVKILWIVISVLPAIYIPYKVNFNEWIIKQRPFFLNGIEYYVLSLFMVAGCFIIFVIVDVIEVIVHRFRGRE